VSSIKLKPFLETANVWVKNSSCCRVQVGAVIFNIKTKRLLSIGYNGTLPGQIHCNKLFQPRESDYLVHSNIKKYLCDVYTESVTEEGWNSVDTDEAKTMHHRFSDLYEVHAEQNAIYNLIKTGASYDTDNLAIVTTVEPCEQCAKAIAALGIKHVFYEVAYDRNTIDIPKYFSRLGIVCRQVESNGEEL